MIAATPNLGISCVLGRNLIFELEAKYQLKWFGPRTKINRSIFYYHLDKEVDFKYKWSVVNLK